jgi:hypothetical protein
MDGVREWVVYRLAYRVAYRVAYRPNQKSGRHASYRHIGWHIGVVGMLGANFSLADNHIFTTTFS